VLLDMRSKRAAGRSVKKRSLVRKSLCEKCGGRLDIPDQPTNNMVISCKACGTPVGTWAEVKHAMKAAARESHDPRSVASARRK